MSFYDRPSLGLRGSCEPSLLFGSSTGPTGFFAQRWPDGAWQVETTPMPVQLGTLALDSLTGDAIAGVDNGAYGVSLWRRSDSLWTKLIDLPGKNHFLSGQLTLDQTGDIHMVYVDQSSTAYYHKHGDLWDDHILAAKAAPILRIGVTSVGAPQVAFWPASGEKPIGLQWSAPPASPESAVSLNWSGIGRSDFAMAVAPDDTSWVLLNGDYDDKDDYSLILAHRDGAGTWNNEQLIAEETVVDTCPAIPQSPGETCESEGTRIKPRAVLASVDQIRALYYWEYHKSSYVAVCEFECEWTHDKPPQHKGELRLAWPGSTKSEHIVLAEDVDNPLSAQLDTSGNIHIAFFQWIHLPLGWAVRYLVIGP